MGQAPRPRKARLSGRALFLTAAAAVGGLVLFTAVVRPAVERGGIGELLLVIAAFAAILVTERWLRTR